MEKVGVDSSGKERYDNRHSGPKRARGEAK